jgi:hypothetical protein
LLTWTWNVTALAAPGARLPLARGFGNRYASGKAGSGTTPRRALASIGGAGGGKPGAKRM